jgi:signal transduction histidine kinase
MLHKAALRMIGSLESTGITDMGRFTGHRAAAGFISACAGAALALLVGIGLAEAQSRQVLIIHSFGRNFLPWSEYATAIRTELERQTSWPLSIHDHPLFTAATDDDNPEAAFAEYLRALYKRKAPDLMLTIGAPAARFVQRHRASIFPTVPAVFTAVDQRFVQKDALTDYDTAVPVSIELLPLFQNILQLLPATKLIALMMGNSPPERLWVNEIQKELKALEGRVVVSYYNDRSFDDMLKIAATLPPDSAIFWNQLRVDAAGIVYEGWGPLQRMFAAANAPIFSYDDVFFKGETVGGPMLSMTEVARKTASVAVQLLAGEKAANFTIEPIGLAPPRYDWRQLQRWHIGESRLPPGSEIHFRSPAAWEQYRWQIVAVATVLLLQAAMIAGLLYEHRRRRNAEMEARQRMSELAHVNRQATAGELSASIAHELNQPLGAILNNAETGAIILNSPSPNLDEMKTIIDEIRRDDNRATEVIRRLRRLLGKSAIEAQDIELNATVHEVFEILAAQAAARDVKLKSGLVHGPLRVRGDRIQLQQVILNLVVNGMDAMVGATNGRREVTTSTSVDAASVKISIADSGPGIPSDKLKTIFEPFFTTKSDGMGVGLSIARTIVEAHGGRIWAENRTAGGAVFHVSLPLAKAN